MQSNLWTATGVAPIWLAGDYTGDGYTDVIEYANGYLKIHANDGTGKLTMSPSSSLFVDVGNPAVSTVSLAAADVNADQCVDVIMSSAANGHRVFLGACTAVAGSANVALTYPVSPQTTSVAGCNGPSVVFDANVDG